MLILLSVVLLILKLTGVIGWSWWIVAAPVLVALGFWLALMAGILGTMAAVGRGLNL